MVAVDGQHIEGFAPAGRPVHRVDRHAVVDPAGGIALEERVRHRWDDKIAGLVQYRDRSRAQGDLSEPGQVKTQFHHLGSRQAADQMLGQHIGLQFPQELAHLVHQRPAHGVLGGDQVDDILTGFVGGRQRFAKQIQVQVDLDAAIAHGLDKLVVLPLGALHPQHIVEQQLVMIGRG